jgi:transcriptional regulator with XRE-family HTH domain
MIRQRLSINVRSLRNGALLTLKKSSERAEMHWRHWQKIEAGQVNITLQTLVRLAEVLGIDPADLLREPPAREQGKGSELEKAEAPMKVEPNPTPAGLEEVPALLENPAGKAA